MMFEVRVSGERNDDTQMDDMVLKRIASEHGVSLDDVARKVADYAEEVEAELDGLTTGEAIKWLEQKITETTENTLLRDKLTALFAGARTDH
jgi:hypothetical protein